jgi:hypothetical protein
MSSGRGKWFDRIPFDGDSEFDGNLGFDGDPAFTPSAR